VYTKYVPSIKGDLDPKVYETGYLGKMGSDEIWDSAASRLISADLVCTKSQLLVHDHMETLSRVLLSDECSIETRELIEMEKRAQRQESVFNPKVLREIPMELPIFLEDSLVDSLLDLSRSGNHHLKSILSGEEVFEREALDAIKMRGPTMVNLQMTTKKGLRYPI